MMTLFIVNYLLIVNNSYFIYCYSTC